MFKSNLKVGSFSKVRIAGLLESGHLVGVAPGGARECLFDYDCQVLWKKRYNDPNNLIIQFLINVFMVHLLGLDSQRWRIWQKYQSSQFTQKISDWLTPPFHSHPPCHGDKNNTVHHQNLWIPLRTIYELTRLPLVLLYGGFPVTLRTHIGPQIFAINGETPEHLQIRLRSGF